MMNGITFIARGGLISLISILALSCSNSSKEASRIPPVTFGNVIFPEPMFDKGLNELIDECKEKYKANEVIIGRPTKYTSDKDYSYWLKVEFLNPELGDKTFQSFGKEVASNIFNHLTNKTKFDNIEISVVYKKGFIITFSKKQSTFFFRDSLQIIEK